jgi:hypothetical protein
MQRENLYSLNMFGKDRSSDNVSVNLLAGLTGLTLTLRAGYRVYCVIFI